jgi:hypothetical protein
METHVTDIIHVIQLAVAPLLLLSEVASRRWGFVAIQHPMKSWLSRFLWLSDLG